MARDKGRKAIEKKNKVLQRLSVEYVPISEVKPNTYNPNRQSEHDFDLLLKSMEEDGFTQPIVVLVDGTIVDGEHRWRAADRLGFEEVPVVRVDMTPEQVRISTLRHNRARGSEDYDLTAALFQDLRELGALDWAQDSLLLDDLELQRLLEDVPAPEALAADEYGEAWTPGERGETEGGDGFAATPAAIAAMREQERREREALTEEDRKAARKDADIYRISLVFSGDEAKVVKAVLKDRPAENLLRLCRSVIDQADAEAATEE